MHNITQHNLISKGIRFTLIKTFKPFGSIFLYFFDIFNVNKEELNYKRVQVRGHHLQTSTSITLKAFHLTFLRYGMGYDRYAY